MKKRILTIIQSHDIIAKTAEKGTGRMSLGIEEDNKKTDEHILVCLSAAPSNKKIIDTAAKMANALQARFTALYVRTGTKSEDLDKEKLEEHIRYAENLGAEIVMTHGENIPVQIAEYARLSNVTKIVIGQSNARRNHFFSKVTLTEKLIEIVPDIDIHIIPDTVKTGNYQKRSFTWYMEKPSAKDYFLTVFIFAVCTLIGLLFQKLDFTDTNIVTIYILGVLITSIVTDGYLCSVAGSFLSVFLFCFFLTEPRMSFETYAVGYPVTFFIMLISSVLTGTLAAKLKMHAKLSSQIAFRTQVLFDTDRLLQKAKSETEILGVTCTQLIRLLNRSITAYVVENGTLSEGKLFSGEKESTEDFLTQEEQQAARWTYENRQRAGASTQYFSQAKCLYLAIRSGNNVYGVIGIPLQKETLDSFEYSILLSVINECALAMENAQNAMEKEKNAVIAKNEQLRADLLRALSHDLRTPLASIEGADSLLLEQPDLSEAERRTLLEQIRQETRWLTRITENMLSVTRMAGEQVSLHRTDEVVEEIVDSAVMKLRRSRHALPVTVIRPQEILTAPMDATLMEQVILNLLENAVNHAEGATRIRVEIAGQGDTVMIAVEDDGAGFPPELLPQLFDRKLLPQPRSCADGRRGLGLGLTLCSAIIKAHGGRMTAENRPEGGARVCLWLPAGTEDEEETEG